MAVEKIEKYGLMWERYLDPVHIEMKCIQWGSEWEFNGRKVGAGSFHHYRELQRLIWPEDDHHRWSDLMLEEILKNRITAIMGPKDCVSGNTRLVDPITGEQPTIQYLAENGIAPTVMTLKGPVKAGVPFCKGIAELFQVECENGHKFTGTAGHLVLTEGGFVSLKSLVHGQRLLSYEQSPAWSNLESSPLIQSQGARHSLRTIQDFQFGYLPSLCFCDEPLRFSLNAYPDIVPLQDDAPTRSHGYLNLDDLVCGFLRSHLCQQSDHLSNDRFYFQTRNKLEVISEPHQCVSEIDLHENDSYRLPWRSYPRMRSSQSFVAEVPCFSRMHSLGKYRVLKNRVNKIRRIGVGKYYDLTVPCAHHYFSEGCIHHNSGKTHVALAKFSLTDYFCFPNETLILISSTDLRGLELRVWGDLKSLFQRAKERCPFLPGHLIDSKHAVSTANIKEGEVRDMRKGVVCIPCMSAGGSWIGLGKYVGIKQKRRRLLSDEAQFMRPSFLDSLANLNSGDFKGVFVGNPIGENDPLDKIAEPKEGWGTEGEFEVTTCWDNKFIEGRTINLVGTDSPNFDFPQDEEPRYPYLIHQKSIDNVVSFYGKDSLQYWSQCKGRRRVGLDSRRVITKRLCQKFHAFEQVVWRDNYRIRIYAVDAAYGGTGGDRCVGGMIEFGRDINNKVVILVHEPVIIPVSVANDRLPEDQIAEFVKSECERLEIPANHVFYDSTGRGSLGTSFARVWSAYVNPVEFGGRPTERSVSANLMIYDESERRQRFKRCDEQYSKFVTELWWSVRLVIESDQMRGLPEHVADEGCAREWKMVKGDKIEIETKADMKERVGYSPDKFDWLVTCIEGARRLGFVINKLASKETVEVDTRWKTQMKERARQLRKSYSLDYAA